MSTLTHGEYLNGTVGIMTTVGSCTRPSFHCLRQLYSLFFEPTIGMSRHNRRRIRGSQRPSTTPFRHDGLTSPTNYQLADSTSPGLSAPLIRTISRRNDVSARHWFNRYIAWQNRDRKQREEREKLISEQRRIFGGESDEGDEDGLCSRMLEFYGGLDYLQG